MSQAGPYFKPAKIMVPTDFSPSSDRALASATDLAEHYHAHLFLLHVIPAFPVTTGLEFPTTFYPQQEFLDDARKRAEGFLLLSITDLAKRGLQARSVVEIGNDVVGNILNVAERERVDMVVLSTHGLSGWRPVVFGSTAEKVVKLLQCPLLLLRSAKPSSDPKGLDIRGGDEHAISSIPNM
jgi:nucleotide-binding universal stress UspA family protein